MTLRHLNIFITVCNLENMTAAANKLYMSQPAVSQCIKELETHYNVILFERINKKLYITESGHTLYNYATHILSLFNDVDQTLRNQELPSKLHIGANITAGVTMIQNYICTFNKLHPNVDVCVTVNNSTVLEGMLNRNELDFALLEDMNRNAYYVCEPFYKDRLVIVASPKHPLATQKEVTLTELISQKLLLREKGAGVRDLFESTALALGQTFTPSWESCSSKALINAALANLGIAILPYRIVMDYLSRKQLIELSVPEIDLHRNLNIVYHKNKLLSPMAKEFITICKKGRI